MNTNITEMLRDWEDYTSRGIDPEEDTENRELYLKKALEISLEAIHLREIKLDYISKYTLLELATFNLCYFLKDLEEIDSAFFYLEHVKEEIENRLNCPLCSEGEKGEILRTMESIF